MSLHLWKVAGAIVAAFVSVWVTLLVWGVTAAGGRELAAYRDADPAALPTTTTDIVLSVVLVAAAVGAAVAISLVDHRHEARTRLPRLGAGHERHHRRHAA